MKNILGFVVIAIIVCGLAACSDKQAQGEAAAGGDLAPAATLVSQGALAQALWTEAAAKDTGEETPPAEGQASAADCLAASTFTVEGATGFLIKTNVAPTASNTTPVVVVSPVNIFIADGTGAAGCAAGELRYIVTASEESPVDIVVSGTSSRIKPLETIASATPVPYPDACTITAHFEKHGSVACGEQPSEAPAPAEEPTDETKPDEAPEVSENGNPNAPAEEEQPTVSLNREEGAEETPIEAPTEAPVESPADAPTDDAPKACDDGPSVPTIKLVVDTYDCTVSTFVKQPGM